MKKIKINGKFVTQRRTLTGFQTLLELVRIDK